MEASLAQVAAAARKASGQGYCKQGRPPVQKKSAAAGCPLKKGAGRHRSPCAAARNKVRNGNAEPNTYSHKAFNRMAVPSSAIRVGRLPVLQQSLSGGVRPLSPGPNLCDGADVHSVIFRQDTPCNE